MSTGQQNAGPGDEENVGSPLASLIEMLRYGEFRLGSGDKAQSAIHAELHDGHRVLIAMEQSDISDIQPISEARFQL